MHVLFDNGVPRGVASVMEGHIVEGCPSVRPG
jgi:hypothetical protein